jgi:hypothetical protein
MFANLVYFNIDNKRYTNFQTHQFYNYVKQSCIRYALHHCFIVFVCKQRLYYTDYNYSIVHLSLCSREL